MDERHWWIAGKIQDTFHIVESTSSAQGAVVLEQFICRNETLSMINEFLSPNGPCRLFFYATKSGVSASDVHITETLSTKDINPQEATVLYFLRHNVDCEVEASHMEQDIICGELKGNASENLTNLLGEIYIPLMRAKKSWGKATSENHDTLIHTLERALSNVSESALSNQSSKQASTAK